MKKVEALIQPHRLAKVVAALHALPSFPGFTVVDAHGQGHGRGTGGHYVYEQGEGLLFHKRQLLIVICADDLCDRIVDAIVQAAQTRRQGDGMVAVTDVSQLVRIRDGQRVP